MVVWDEIGQNFILILNYKSHDYTIPWHEMVGQLILAEFETDCFLLGHFFVQLEDLWDILTFHYAHISINLNLM